MKRTPTILYSILSTLLLLEFLLTSWSIGNRESFFQNDLVKQDLIIRIVILAVCLFSLIQIYFLHIKGTRLTSISYWLILGLNSATAVYLKYVQDFATTDYLVFGRVLFSVSFFRWTMFLLLGVLFNSFYQYRKDQQIIA